MFGKYVKNLHAKDGLYPTNGRQLGEEVRLGDGKANMPEVLRKLKQLDFQGEIIIEREISGEQQRQDIIYTKQYLENLIEEL